MDFQNSAAALLLSLVLIEVISTISASKGPSYGWANSRWLPRLFWTKHAHEYVQAGYDKFNKLKDAPFKMTWWSRENIFLPPKYLQDLKSADEASLSFLSNISDAFSLHYSVGNLYNGPIMIDIIRKKLNTQLPRVTPILADEADFAISEEIGDAKDWVSRNANDTIGRIMHRMTSRVLVAQEVCRDKNYLDTSLSFMNSVMMTGLLAIMLPLGPLRGLFTRVLVYFHKKKLEATIKIILPIIESRLGEKSDNQKADAIQWAIELAGDDPVERDPRRIALNTLQNIWAGSAGPAVCVTQMIFQALMMPEYLEPLTQEVREAIDEYGWTDKAMNHMPLLDSFIRECNRVYPLGAITAARTVMSDGFTFHDGLTLPRGTRIAFAAGAIQKDERFVENPDKFDGFRFVPKEADTANRALNVASTVGQTNLAFGYGKHACPGRFYAIRKTKIIFSKLVLSYDIKWTKQPNGRPKEFPVEGQFAPNLSQEISFRSLRK